MAGEFRRQKLSAASQPPRDRSSKIVPASQWSSTARNGMQIRQNRFLMQQAHGAIALDPKPKAAEALGLLVNRVDLCGDGIRISIKLPVGSPERLPGQAPNHLSLIRMIPIQMRRRGGRDEAHHRQGSQDFTEGGACSRQAGSARTPVVRRSRLGERSFDGRDRPARESRKASCERDRQACISRSRYRRADRQWCPAA